ncbi:hypothetical protein JL11_07665 [Brevundimonas sp. DS20]|nr:hypothetical protein JL11_07665 [Brevundimonas sp. DS20]
MISGERSLYKSNREKREEQIAAGLPAWIERDREKLEAAEKSVARLRAADVRKASTLGNLRKRLLSGLRSAYSIRNHASEDHRHNAAAEALIAGYDALLDDIAKIEPTDQIKT